MKIAIGNDHAGTEYKFAILDFLKSREIHFKNYGTDSYESVDYPDFVHPVAQAVNLNQVDFGILICGTGNGVAMTANKYANIRAGICWTKEIGTLVRCHNNANILCIPARFTSKQQAVHIAQLFLETPFEGGRHETRTAKIPVKG